MALLFGPFRLDLDAAELTRGARPVRLEPKAFDLLAYMVENPGRLLRREELLDAIWPGAHVTESSLSRAVSLIRAALGDDQPYIETVSRRGYKFVAAVSRDGGGAAVVCRVAYGLQEFVLAAGENLIGRSPDAAVPIRSPEVSRRHARIVISERGVLIEDLGSRNGTRVRGEPVSGPVPLRDGDEIHLGTVLLRFRAITPGASSMTLPSGSS